MRLLVALLCLAIPSPSIAAEDPAVAAVRAQDAALQAAHGRGDMATYLAGLSEHYVYVDIGGERITAEQLRVRREGDQRRVVSHETTEEEGVRLAEGTVMLRGLDRTLALYYGGLPRHGLSRWTALWVREDDGVWRLAAETATPVAPENAPPRFVVTPQPAAVLAAHAGAWTLDTAAPLVLELRAEGDALVGRLAGQRVKWTFRPVSATHWFAAERPFEIRFDADGQTLSLLTWGAATTGRRSKALPEAR